MCGSQTEVKRICDLYDWDGKGELDLFYLGDIFYAMGHNITKKICVGLGQTDEENKKFAKFDDVVKMVSEGLATKVSGGGGVGLKGSWFHFFFVCVRVDI